MQIKYTQTREDLVNCDVPDSNELSNRLVNQGLCKIGEAALIAHGVRSILGALDDKSPALMAIWAECDKILNIHKISKHHEN